LSDRRDLASSGGLVYAAVSALTWSSDSRTSCVNSRSLLEQGRVGSVFHAVADEGVPTREIAEVIGRHLNVPAVSIAPGDAGEHFGWIGAFFAVGAPASSALTQERLGWKPTHPGLIADLEEGHNFTQAHPAAA
jgi:hypothetical protein